MTALGLLAVGCGGDFAVAHRPKQPSTAEAEEVDPWSGIWGGEQSSAVFRFQRHGRRMFVDGWDTKDGEWFVIENVRFDGEVLEFQSTMPSTAWTLQQRYFFEGERTMRNVWTGASEGDEIVHRVLVPVPRR